MALVRTRRGRSCSASARFEQKHAIARCATSVMRTEENILLDAGSTAGALAHKLSAFEKLSITIPAPDTVQELADNDGIGVDCVDGRMRGLSQCLHPDPRTV